MITKRVYELEVGDRFRYYNVDFKVTLISNGRIYYKPSGVAASSTRDSFGEKNKMKVEIIPSGSEEVNMMLLHQPENSCF